MAHYIIHTQIWDTQERGSFQQEACRWNLHQRCEQGAGLHGGQRIFTVGDDIQTFRGEVKQNNPINLIYLYISKAWILSFFCSKKRQVDQWNNHQGLPLSASHNSHTQEYKAILQCMLKCLFFFYLPLYKNTKTATLLVFTVHKSEKKDWDNRFFCFYLQIFYIFEGKKKPNRTHTHKIQIKPDRLNIMR